MTEMERQLLESLKRLESHYTERENLFATKLDDLMKQLRNGAERMNALSAQLDALSQRLEKPQALLSNSKNR